MDRDTTLRNKSLSECQLPIQLLPQKYFSFFHERPRNITIVLITFKHICKQNVTGKGRVESSDDEGSFNDAASMVSDVSEVTRL